MRYHPVYPWRAQCHARSRKSGYTEFREAPSAVPRVRGESAAPENRGVFRYRDPRCHDNMSPGELGERTCMDAKTKAVVAGVLMGVDESHRERLCGGFSGLPVTFNGFQIGDAFANEDTGR